MNTSRVVIEDFPKNAKSIQIKLENRLGPSSISDEVLIECESDGCRTAIAQKASSAIGVIVGSASAAIVVVSVVFAVFFIKRFFLKFRL